MTPAEAIGKMRGAIDSLAALELPPEIEIIGLGLVADGRVEAQIWSPATLAPERRSALALVMDRPGAERTINPLGDIWRAQVSDRLWICAVAS